MRSNNVDFNNISSWLDKAAKASGRNINSANAKRLLATTLAAETGNQFYQTGADPLAEIPNAEGGSARGYFQIQPDTAMDLLDRMSTRKPELHKYITGLAPGVERDSLISRAKFMDKDDPIPAGQLEQNQYWRDNYNSNPVKTPIKDQEAWDRIKLNQHYWGQQGLAQTMGGAQAPVAQAPIPQQLDMQGASPIPPRLDVANNLFNSQYPATEFFKELAYSPKGKEEMYNIDAGPTLANTTAGKTARMIRKNLVDPFRDLGRIMERGYNGEASLEDAQMFAMTAISGGVPGGLPAGATGAGSVTRTSMPFSSRLSKLIDHGKVGDRVFPPGTPLRTLKNKISNDKVLLEEFGHFFGEIPEEGTLGELRGLMGDRLRPEQAMKKTVLTGDDVQYRNYGKFRTQGGDNYQEVLYNDMTHSFDADHFHGLKIEDSRGSKGLAGHRRGHSTPYTDEAGNFTVKGAENLTAKERTDFIQPATERIQRRIDEGMLTEEEGNLLLGEFTEEVLKRQDPDYVPSRSFQLEETQSDLHQTASKAGGYQGDKHIVDEQIKVRKVVDDFTKAEDTIWNSHTPKIVELQEEVDVIKAQQREARNILVATTDEKLIQHNQEKMTALAKELDQKTDKMYEMMETRSKELQSLNEVYPYTQEEIDNARGKLFDLDNTPKPAPYKKSWVQMHVDDHIVDAIESGHDAITWTTGETQARRNHFVDDNGKLTAGAKYYLDTYDKRIVKHFEKKYGVTPTKRLIPDSNSFNGAQEVWHVPINDKMRLLMKNKKRIPMAKIDRFRAFG